MKTFKNLQYGPHAQNVADVYLPTRAQAPIIVFVHGGSWRAGSKDTYGFVGRALARAGIVTVVINYRLWPETVFPGFVQDTALALSWVHREAAQWNGDPERLFVMGHSAGAHIAALCALDPAYLNRPKWLVGCIGLAGVYDFYPAPSLRPVFGAELQAGRRWNPVDVAQATHTKFLLLHGRRDFTVSMANSRTLTQRLRALGISVESKFYNLGHMTIIGTFLWSWLAVPRQVRGFVKGA